MLNLRLTTDSGISIVCKGTYNLLNNYSEMVKEVTDTVTQKAWRNFGSPWALLENYGSEGLGHSFCLI